MKRGDIKGVLLPEIESKRSEAGERASAHGCGDHVRAQSPRVDSTLAEQASSHSRTIE